MKNTSEPSFSQRLRLDYHFESVQNLKLGIYDIDNSSSDLGDDDYLGGAELTLGQVGFPQDAPGGRVRLRMLMRRRGAGWSRLGAWSRWACTAHGRVAVALP